MAWWTQERRAAAQQRGLKYASDPAWRKKIAEAVSRDRNPRWLGGLTEQKYAPGFGRVLKSSIRARDGFACVLCGSTENELGYALTIHHIDYDKSNHCSRNLASVCKACNSRVNSNRDVWQSHFEILMCARSMGLSLALPRARFVQHGDVIVAAFDGHPIEAAVGFARAIGLDV